MLRPVHETWSRVMLLGAHDLYGAGKVSALQIVPDAKHWTIDVPDMSIKRSKKALAWRWLDEKWPYDIPETSTAATNLAALRGQRVTEAARWEADEWELFAGAGPDVIEEDMRVVPVTCLLGVDSSLERTLQLDPGQALWRDARTGPWNSWEKK